MKKQNLSRYVSLGLLLVMLLVLFTGCAVNGSAQATNEDGTLKLV